MFKKICYLALAAFSIFAQNTSVKEWKVFTSMKEVKSVSILGNTVWASSLGGLFSFYAASLSDIKKFTSLDGLLSNE